MRKRGEEEYRFRGNSCPETPETSVILDVITWSKLTTEEVIMKFKRTSEHDGISNQVMSHRKT